jgi:hypothetical protein
LVTPDAKRSGAGPSSRDPLAEPPASDADVADWVAACGLGGHGGLVDLHVHFLPERMLQKVWAYFDRAADHYGRPWPVHYRLPEDERLARLRGFGVETFAPLVYPHKPGMAAWLTNWALEWAAQVPEAVPTATVYPEESVTEYLGAALDAGARAVKAHVQIGRYDPRDPLLAPAWGLIADAGVPVIAHCGNGPIEGLYTGMDIFAEVLRAHPTLTVVLAHAGLPEYSHALELAVRYPNVHLDTTMVGTAFTEEFAPLPADWPARLAEVGHKVALGTDFPNIPYGYWEQLAVIARWAASDDRLGTRFLQRVLHDNPKGLLAAP